MHGELNALLKGVILKVAFTVLAVVALLLAVLCTGLILRKALRKQSTKTKLVAGCLLAPALALAFAFAIVSAATLSLVYFWAKPENKRRCIRGMQSIAQAGRAWAEGHDGRLPANLLSLSNSFSQPQVFICPATGRFASGWNQFSAADSSYELVTPGLRVEETNTVFLRCTVHAHGACLDGRIQ